MIFSSRIIIWSSSIDARVFITASTCLRLRAGIRGADLCANSDPRLDVQPDHSDDSTEEDSTKLAAIQEERRNGNLIRVHLIFVFCMLKDSAVRSRRSVPIFR